MIASLLEQARLLARSGSEEAVLQYVQQVLDAADTEGAGGDAPRAAALLRTAQALATLLAFSDGQHVDAVAPQLAVCMEGATAAAVRALSAASDAESANRLSAGEWTHLAQACFDVVGRVLALAPLGAKDLDRLSSAMRALLEALLQAPAEGSGAVLAGLREAVVQRRRQQLHISQSSLPLAPADAAALMLRVARGPLALLPGEGDAGAAVVAAGAGPGTPLPLLYTDLAWSVARHVVGPATHAPGLLSAQQTEQLSVGACQAIEAALRLLRPTSAELDTGASPPRAPAAVPTLPFVSGAAHVAAASASSLCSTVATAGSSSSGVAAEAVADTLLSLVEDCCALAAELGLGDRAAGAVLRAAEAAARELALPLASCLAPAREALPDLLTRLQPLLVGAGRLAGRPARGPPGCRVSTPLPPFHI